MSGCTQDMDEYMLNSMRLNEELFYGSDTYTPTEAEKQQLWETLTSCIYTEFQTSLSAEKVITRVKLLRDTVTACIRKLEENKKVQHSEFWAFARCEWLLKHITKIKDKTDQARHSDIIQSLLRDNPSRKFLLPQSMLETGAPGNQEVNAECAIDLVNDSEDIEQCTPNQQNYSLINDQDYSDNVQSGSTPSADEQLPDIDVGHHSSGNNFDNFEIRRMSQNEADVMSFNLPSTSTSATIHPLQDSTDTLEQRGIEYREENEEQVSPKNKAHGLVDRDAIKNWIDGVVEELPDDSHGYPSHSSSELQRPQKPTVKPLNVDFPKKRVAASPSNNCLGLSNDLLPSIQAEAAKLSKDEEAEEVAGAIWEQYSWLHNDCKSTAFKEILEILDEFIGE